MIPGDWNHGFFLGKVVEFAGHSPAGDIRLCLGKLAEYDFIYGVLAAEGEDSLRIQLCLIKEHFFLGAGNAGRDCGSVDLEGEVGHGHGQAQAGFFDAAFF